MKKGCLISVILVIILISFFFYGLKHAFDTEYETAIINQNIGGQLICKSTYNADIHSWVYDIDYSYVNSKNDTIEIGTGYYYGREWEKSEQLIKYSHFLILKSGSSHGADRIFIGKKDSSDWTSFDISPETIENDSLWVSRNIYSKMNWLPQESFISKFDNGLLHVDYLYRIGELVEETERRRITYQIDELTGIPKMVDIKLIE